MVGFGTAAPHAVQKRDWVFRGAPHATHFISDIRPVGSNLRRRIA